MKFKITCNSQIRNSIVKKFISSSLIVGLLFNGSSLSLASILSEDGRCETFEGNNITIDNVLEEDKVDVEIEGNTLVNLVINDEILSNGSSIYYYNQNYNTSSGVYTIKNVSNKPINVGVFSTATNPMEYLRQIRIEGNSSMTHVLNDNECFKDIVGSFSDGWSSATDKDLFKKSILIFKGDLDDVNIIKYFDGMKSSGELENNKIDIISQKYNEFTNSTDNLICHFKPSPSSIEEDTLKDLSGNNNNAVLVNVSSADIKNDYIQFNGVNSYATIDRVIEDDFTIMIKAQIDVANDKNTSIPDVNKNQWFNHSGIIDGEMQGVKYDFGLTITGDGYPVIGIGNPDRTDYYKDNCLGLMKTYIFSRNKNEGVVRLYIDGDLVGEIEDTTKNSLTAPITLSIAKSNGLNLFTKMKLYELKIYNKSLDKTNIMESNKKKILLSEPLRGLPSGVKDRIIKRNGQWVIERNTEIATLNGTEGWIMVVDKKQKTACFYTKNIRGIASPDDKKTSTPTLSNLFVGSSYDWLYTDDDGIETSYTAWDGNLCLSIQKSKLSSVDVNGFNKWLSVNKPSIIYQLAEPVYEPLNVSPELNLYLETTHLSNDSNIPANMRVVIDRTMNRAVEAIELAKTNPTAVNISQARMWANLLKESAKKDELQNELNNITNIEDLELEKKTATANLDVYVKSENALSMSLSTNSVTFEGYNGTEDLEKLNAVDIVVSSSLPYDLNAYLEESLQNSDRTSIINPSTINIKEASNTDYSQFVNNTDKVVLKSDCEAINNRSHSIDLKLASDDAHKADVYKAVIKFEVVQK